MKKLIPVILSGGSGTRLWPVSRKHYPKQFHQLTGSTLSLLQETAERVRHLAAPIVVCNEDHRFMMAEQLLNIEIEAKAIILEPAARNTAPAIALAAFHALADCPEAMMVVLPADHVIKNQAVFMAALETAVQAAEDAALVTFGIVPSKPETGYGYIQAKEKSGEIRGVSRFVEKPDLSTAESYLASGDYFWNSGMFVFKARAYLEALQQFCPQIYSICESCANGAVKDLDFIRIDKTEFSECPSDSIDYAIMEKAGNVKMVPLDADWNDVGSWSSLWETLPKDEQNNALIGDIISIDTRNTLVHSLDKDKLIVTIGLDDITIVETKNALLVAKRDKAQDVKAVVEQLSADDRQEHLFHREVHRPWGSYDSIQNGERFQVKRICVKPGASLSLQMHHHRAEHWVVVSGTAIVRVGDTESLLTENQSVYIPIGAKHRLTNPGKLPLELIEVQSGSYLGEDDIVRFEDVFGRC